MLKILLLIHVFRSCSFSLIISWFFCFENLQSHTIYLSAMQYLHCLSGALFLRIFNVTAISVRQQIHVDQVAETAEGLLQDVYGQWLWKYKFWKYNQKYNFYGGSQTFITQRFSNRQNIWMILQFGNRCFFFQKRIVEQFENLWLLTHFEGHFKLNSDKENKINLHEVYKQ